MSLSVWGRLIWHSSVQDLTPAEGKKILDELMIDGFIAPKEESYDPILAMQKNM